MSTMGVNRCLQRMPPTGFLPTDANGCQRVPTGANGFFCQRVPNNGFFCQRCPLPNNGFFCQRVSTTGWKKNHGHFVLGYGGFLATGVHNGCSRWGGSVGSPRVSRQAGRQACERACVFHGGLRDCHGIRNIAERLHTNSLDAAIFWCFA